MIEKKIYNNINFLKFCFVLVVVYYHIIASKFPFIYPDINWFRGWASKSGNSGFFSVFMMFIVSGYFLGKTFSKDTLPPFKDFVIRRCIRFLPVLIFSTFLIGLLPQILSCDARPHIQPLILNIFFLHKNIKLATFDTWNGVSWFICALFWVSLFYWGLVKTIINKTNSNFLISLIVFIGLVFLNNKVENYRDIITAFTAVGIGYLLYQVSPPLTSGRERLRNGLQEALWGCIEMGAFICLLWPVIFKVSLIKEPILYYILGCFVVYLFIQNKGWFSKFLNLKLFNKISQISFSTYLMQEVCFVILQASFWKASFPIQHPVLAFVISFIFCIFVGFLTYLFVEKPATNYLTNKYIQRKE